MLAAALQSQEVETRLDKPPRGPHRRVAHLARQAFDHQEEKAGGQLSIRAFAKLTGKSYTAVNNWLDGTTRIRSDSEEILRRLSAPDVRRGTSSEADALVLDPTTGQPYDPSGSESGGNIVENDTHQARIVARWLNRIEDDDLRDEAMIAAREAIKRFLDVGPDKAGPSPRK